MTWDALTTSVDAVASALKEESGVEIKPSNLFHAPLFWLAKAIDGEGRSVSRKVSRKGGLFSLQRADAVLAITRGDALASNVQLGMTMTGKITTTPNVPDVITDALRQQRVVDPSLPYTLGEVAASEAITAGRPTNESAVEVARQWREVEIAAANIVNESSSVRSAFMRETDTHALRVDGTSVLVHIKPHGEVFRIQRVASALASDTDAHTCVLRVTDRANERVFTLTAELWGRLTQFVADHPEFTSTLGISRHSDVLEWVTRPDLLRVEDEEARMAAVTVPPIVERLQSIRTLYGGGILIPEGAKQWLGELLQFDHKGADRRALDAFLADARVYMREYPVIPTSVCMRHIHGGAAAPLNAAQIELLDGAYDKFRSAPYMQNAQCRELATKIRDGNEESVKEDADMRFHDNRIIRDLLDSGATSDDGTDMLSSAWTRFAKDDDDGDRFIDARDDANAEDTHKHLGGVLYNRFTLSNECAVPSVTRAAPSTYPYSTKHLSAQSRSEMSRQDLIRQENALVAEIAGILKEQVSLAATYADDLLDATTDANDRAVTVAFSDVRARVSRVKDTLGKITFESLSESTLHNIDRDVRDGYAQISQRVAELVAPLDQLHAISERVLAASGENISSIQAIIKKIGPLYDEWDTAITASLDEAEDVDARIAKAREARDAYARSHRGASAARGASDDRPARAVASRPSEVRPVTSRSARSSTAAPTGALLRRHGLELQSRTGATTMLNRLNL